MPLWLGIDWQNDSDTAVTTAGTGLVREGAGIGWVWVWVRYVRAVRRTRQVKSSQASVRIAEASAREFGVFTTGV